MDSTVVKLASDLLASSLFGQNKPFTSVVQDFVTIAATKQPGATIADIQAFCKNPDQSVLKAILARLGDEQKQAFNALVDLAQFTSVATLIRNSVSRLNAFVNIRDTLEVVNPEVQQLFAPYIPILKRLSVIYDVYAAMKALGHKENDALLIAMSSLSAVLENTGTSYDGKLSYQGLLNNMAIDVPDNLLQTMIDNLVRISLGSKPEKASATKQVLFRLAVADMQVAKALNEMVTTLIQDGLALPVDNTPPAAVPPPLSNPVVEEPPGKEIKQCNGLAYRGSQASVELHVKKSVAWAAQDIEKTAIEFSDILLSEKIVALSDAQKTKVSKDSIAAGLRKAITRDPRIAQGLQNQYIGYLSRAMQDATPAVFSNLCKKSHINEEIIAQFFRQAAILSVFEYANLKSYHSDALERYIVGAEKWYAENKFVITDFKSLDNLIKSVSSGSHHGEMAAEEAVDILTHLRPMVEHAIQSSSMSPQMKQQVLNTLMMPYAFHKAEGRYDLGTGVSASMLLHYIAMYHLKGKAAANYLFANIQSWGTETRTHQGITGVPTNPDEFIKRQPATGDWAAQEVPNPDEGDFAINVMNEPKVIEHPADVVQTLGDYWSDPKVLKLANHVLSYLNERKFSPRGW